ncbi:hypothetical protein R6Q57_016162 [Mikania cordata]
MCVVTKPYMVFVEHKVKEDKRAVEDYVNDERRSNIKWNDVDHLDNVSVLWNHFEQMEIMDRQEDIKKRDGKGKEIESSSESEKVTTLEEMVTLLDLIEHVHISLLNKETLRKRFDEMVKWFIKGVLKQSSSWPPIIDYQVISLYDLYLSVRINGGKEKAEVEADDDAGGDGDGGELHVAEVTGEGLGDDVHREGGDTAEDGGAHYVPKLL